jgi:hypothetical protein
LAPQIGICDIPHEVDDKVIGLRAGTPLYIDMVTRVFERFVERCLNRSPDLILIVIGHLIAVNQFN